MTTPAIAPRRGGGCGARRRAAFCVGGDVAGAPVQAAAMRAAAASNPTRPAWRPAALIGWRWAGTLDALIMKPASTAVAQLSLYLHDRAGTADSKGAIRQIRT